MFDLLGGAALEPTVMVWSQQRQFCEVARPSVLIAVQLLSLSYY